jgi:hypothetical protein
MATSRAHNSDMLDNCGVLHGSDIANQVDVEHDMLDV